MKNTKRCSACKEYKDLSEFYKNKSKKDGLSCQCKSCARKYDTKYYEEHAEEKRNKAKAWYRSNKESALQYAARYRNSHREELREYAKKRRIENSEKVREINRKSYAKNREKWIAHARKLRLENPEYLMRYRETNREELRKKGRKYISSHLDTVRINTQNYRARKRKAEGRHSIKDMRRTYKEQEGLCYYCGKSVAWEDRHDDHIMPVSRGGSNWPNNMAITCATCNIQKGNKTAEEYIAWLNKNK